MINRIVQWSLAWTVVATAPAAAGQNAPDGYLDHAALAARLQALAANPLCSVDVIGASRENRGLFVLTLSGDQAAADQRPALLIVGGIDGRHLVGTETALRVAGRLLDEHAQLLQTMTVYVIPRMNPDGAEINFSAVRTGQAGGMRSVDDDRDAAADEDGPDDLNHDGMITMMRRPDPPLDDPPTDMADPVEPRLLKKPDSSKGERAVYSIYSEGIDNDGDGRINEDPPGSVDLDRNFMHLWPQFEPDAGPYQLSEPESFALAQFVLKHPRIVAAVVYGRHDNVINVPDGKEKDASGQAPRNLDADDVKLYQEVSKLYKDKTGQQRAAGADTAGSFQAWLYAQRGIPTFATTVWGRPDPSPDPAAETAPEKKKDDAPKPADEEAAAWLKYSDRDRGGAGFIPWTAFEHPTLGRVEIGGMAPGFTMNPPAEALDELATKQTDFIVELLGRAPKLRFVGPEVKPLASGLYEIRFGIVNDGYLPTTTVMARRSQAIAPTVVRLSVPVEQIVAGQRVSRDFGIDGSGGRAVHEWIVRVDDGAPLTIDVLNSQLGDQKIEFAAEQSAATQPDTAPAEQSSATQPLELNK